MSGNEPYGGFSTDFSSDGFRAVDGPTFKHPYVTFFHLAFRTAALLTYLFCNIFSSSFIGSFVTIVLLLSLDFWTVKNVTGRIMVGLRWWNFINDEGKSEWIFEARNGDSQHLLSNTEIQIFWSSLVLAPAFWLIFFFTALARFNFQWLVLVIIGLTLSSSNLLGYMRCKLGKTDPTASMKSMANVLLQRQMLNSVMGMFSRGQQSTTSATPSNVI